MKQALVILILAGAIAAGIFVLKRHTPEAKPEEKPAAEEQKVTRNEKGQVVVKMSDEVQGNVGLLVSKPEAAQLSPEIRGYGRVMDSAPLAALMTEIAAARAAAAASSNELARLKLLSGQGNASQRALQTAEAAALHDQITAQSATERLKQAWGAVDNNQKDLVTLVSDLSSQKAALVRVELSAGDRLDAAPKGARLFTLSGTPVAARFLGDAPNVDPQTLSRGYILLVQPNSARLLPGEAVTAFLEVPGDPASGVTVPRDAVVRVEGAGWVYVLDAGGDAFIRKQINLDHPTEAGWFVTGTIGTNDHVVVHGAQTLLSEELKASLKPD